MVENVGCKEAGPVGPKMHAIRKQMLKCNVPMADEIVASTKAVPPQCIISLNNISGELYVCKNIDETVILRLGFFFLSWLQVESILLTIA